MVYLKILFQFIVSANHLTMCKLTGQTLALTFLQWTRFTHSDIRCLCSLIYILIYTQAVIFSRILANSFSNVFYSCSFIYKYVLRIILFTLHRLVYIYIIYVRLVTELLHLLVSCVAIHRKGWLPNKPAKENCYFFICCVSGQVY